MAEEPISSNLSTTDNESADKIVSNHDLLLQILIRLPIKSLLRFKSVSKQWLSLISDRRFCRRWRPTSSPSGMFLHWFLYEYGNVYLPRIDFISLDNNANSSPNLQFFPYLHGITFFNSTNGLLCCAVCNSELEPKVSYQVSYHVINPSTRQFTTLPQPSLSNLQLLGLTMAFDPAKSPHYKLVSVFINVDECSYSSTYYQLEIYSSETRSWNASYETFRTSERSPNFCRGVYWNGAIVWLDNSGESVFFQIEEEHPICRNIPAVTFEEGFWYDRDFCVEESNGHLYLVETYRPNTKVKVYEMESDFSSGWAMKYRIDLFEMGKAFPMMLNYSLLGSILPYSFAILSLVWRRRDDDDHEEEEEAKKAPFVVVSIPGKMIRFNLEEKSFMEICDADTTYFSTNTRHYIECLFSTQP